MNEKNTNHIIKNNISRIILVALFIFTFLFGWLLGHQDSNFSKIGFTPKLTTNGSKQSVDFAIFWRAWDLISKNYDGTLNLQNMVYGAVQGMVMSIGDPYTNFLSAEDAKKLDEELTGTISGIGAEVGKKDNRIIIIAPLEDSPAKKAGIISGDVIISIDGSDTQGMDINTAVNKIRGEAGTKVKLLIMRNKNPKEFDITRENFTVNSVKSEIKNNIGIIIINRFDDKTTSLLQDVIDDYQSKNINKIVLDLRDNPGGYLDQSVSVSSEFIKNGLIVSERNTTKNGDKTNYKASGKGKMTDSKYKIIVLVNGGTASAAEIVAGALKDNNRAKVVGEKTFGKGSVQEIEDLPNNAKLKITIAHWYTPKGKNISKEGIIPDYIVSLNQSDIDSNKDPQLDKAIELLK